jgi:bacterioferritin-associated ferredoxin
LREEGFSTVYICHCKAVTDASIRSAIDGGARTIDEVSAHCRAGTGCGGCWPALFEILERSLGMSEQRVEIALVSEPRVEIALAS